METNVVECAAKGFTVYYKVNGVEQPPRPLCEMVGDLVSHETLVRQLRAALHEAGAALAEEQRLHAAARAEAIDAQQKLDDAKGEIAVFRSANSALNAGVNRLRGALDEAEHRLFLSRDGNVTLARLSSAAVLERDKLKSDLDHEIVLRHETEQKLAAAREELDEIDRDELEGDRLLNERPEFADVDSYTELAREACRLADEVQDLKHGRGPTNVFNVLTALGQIPAVNARWPNGTNVVDAVKKLAEDFERAERRAEHHARDYNGLLNDLAGIPALSACWLIGTGVVDAVKKLAEDFADTARRACRYDAGMHLWKSTHVDLVTTLREIPAVHARFVPGVPVVDAVKRLAEDFGKVSAKLTAGAEHVVSFHARPYAGKVGTATVAFGALQDPKHWWPSAGGFVKPAFTPVLEWKPKNPFDRIIVDGPARVTIDTTGPARIDVAGPVVLTSVTDSPLVGQNPGPR